ncbi:outer membrane protein TolC [Pedobacter sp. UYP24]
MESFRKYMLLLLVGVIFFEETSLAQQPEVKEIDLEYFVSRAERSSPLIKDFSNQLLINKIDSLRIRAGYRPQVSASSTGLYAPRINGYGFDEVMTNGQSLDALLNVDYNLLGKNLRENQFKALRLQRDSLNYAVGISKLDIIKSITEQYIQAYDSQEQVAFNLEVLQLLKKEESILKELTRRNVYKQSEYLIFLVTYKQQQLQHKQAELQLKSDLATLNYLSGINDSTTFVLAEPKLNEEITNTSKGSFFTKRFEIDSLKAANDRKAIDLNYKPKINLYANGGYNSSLVLQPYKNFGASVGFRFLVPIYDGNQKKMQQDRISLQSNTSAAYKGFFINQKAQQIMMLRQQIEATHSLTIQIMDQIKLSKGLIDVNIQLLHTGDVKITDFVVAINNYMAAQNAMRQSNINHLKLVNQLNYWSR